LLLVVLHTLGFTAAYDALAFERAALTGDHGALPFFPAAVVVKHDPISGHVHLVHPRGVREQRHIVAMRADGTGAVFPAMRQKSFRNPMRHDSLVCDGVRGIVTRFPPFRTPNGHL
jgi:hypothetical protein